MCGSCQIPSRSPSSSSSRRQKSALRWWHFFFAWIWNLVICGPLLWGQARGPLEHLRREFQRRQTGQSISAGQLKWSFVILILLIGVVGATAWILDRFKNRRPYTSRWLLFLELCWVHRLPIKQIWQLGKWVRQAGIHPPARVFTEPELWEDRVDFVTLAAGTAPKSPWESLYQRCFRRLVPTHRILIQESASSNNSATTPPADGVCQ